MATPKPVSQSRVEHTHLVMPGEANNLGSAFGGMIMEWTDVAGAMAGMRHARCPVVTVSIDQLTFLAPIRIGQMALLTAQVNAVFATSMEIGVEVSSEDPMTGERRKCCDAYLTFVALGPDRRPIPIPPLLAETEEEQRREREARVRREARLALRARLKGA